MSLARFSKVLYYIKTYVFSYNSKGAFKSYIISSDHKNFDSNIRLTDADSKPIRWIHQNIIGESNKFKISAHNFPRKKNYLGQSPNKSRFIY